MHAHILIFSRDLREPPSRFLELSFCIVLSSLELYPATFSCVGLPEPQPLFPQLSETAVVCWGHPLPPPALLGLQCAARVILGLILFVSVLSGIIVLYCLLSSVYKQWCRLFYLVFWFTVRRKTWSLLLHQRQQSVG